MVQTILFAKQKQRHGHREEKYGHPGWGDRGSGMNRETGMDLCTAGTMHKTGDQWEPAVELSEPCPALGADTREGDERGGTDIQIAGSLCRAVETDSAH